MSSKKKIGLIDVDGHNFPNIPLMKISAYHKARGGDQIQVGDNVIVVTLEHGLHDLRDIVES